MSNRIVPELSREWRAKVTFPKSSVPRFLGFIEDRIDQLDALNPQDARELVSLLRCRERLKVTGTSADLSDNGTCIEILRESAHALQNPSLIQEAHGPSMDVV
jgi:hypothetical protein